MIILAANPNEKGARLEFLTKQLLQELGYKNCRTNTMDNAPPEPSKDEPD